VQNKGVEAKLLQIFYRRKKRIFDRYTMTKHTFHENRPLSDFSQYFYVKKLSNSQATAQNLHKVFAFYACTFCKITTLTELNLPKYSYIINTPKFYKFLFNFTNNSFFEARRPVLTRLKQRRNCRLWKDSKVRFCSSYALFIT
jgi:hypothetical protein